LQINNENIKTKRVTDSATSNKVKEELQKMHISIEKEPETKKTLTEGVDSFCVTLEEE